MVMPWSIGISVNPFNLGETCLIIVHLHRDHDTIAQQKCGLVCSMLNLTYFKPQFLGHQPNMISVKPQLNYRHWLTDKEKEKETKQHPNIGFRRFESGENIHHYTLLWTFKPHVNVTLHCGVCFLNDSNGTVWVTIILLIIIITYYCCSCTGLIRRIKTLWW